MFQGIAWLFELIFGLLTIPKCDVIKVEKAMFQRLTFHFELIFASWSAQNATWVRSKKRCFKVSNGILNLFSATGLAENPIWWSRKSDDSSGRQSLGTHYLPLDQSKIRLGWSRERYVQGVACHFELFSGFLTIPKCDLGEFEKAMF